MLGRSVLGAVTAALIAAPPAVAAPDLTVTASHARATYLRATPPNTSPYSGILTLNVTNAGGDSTDGTLVSVGETLPAGLTALTNNPALGAGPVAASGVGWTCAGTASLTCTRNDILAAGASYPPIRVTVNVANDAASSLLNAPSVVGGGDASSFTTTDEIAVAADACPNGWPASAQNPERVDGCSLLDLVWESEPFGDRSAFEARVRAVASQFLGADPDAIIAATPNPVAGVDNSCQDRIALTFDDGPAYYRPGTLAALRAKQVPATFFNLAVRHIANPQLRDFTLAEGHRIGLHTYDHARMTNLSANGLRFEIETAAALLGTGLLPVLRPPFNATNATVNEAAAARGFAMDVSNPAGALEFIPGVTGAQVRDALLAALRPGRVLIVHDGPIDTPTGQNVVDALGEFIDGARERGYCFGVFDDAGRVVATHYTNSGLAIPQIVNPVPYIPLGFAGTPPSPWFLVPQPLRVDATHAPEVFVRGGIGTITLTVSNPTTDLSTDDNPTVVTHAMPPGLSSLGASGEGWTCTGATTVSCTRSTVLAPGTSLPPITIRVSVATSAPAVINTAPRVTGRGGNVWVHGGSDRISTATPVPGDIGGTVPATLSLTLGAAAGFGAFIPGATRTYTATTTATVTSTAGDATLAVSDPDTVAPGRLANGVFTLTDPLRAAANGGLQSAVTHAGAPVLTYDRPVSNDVASLAFTQTIGASEALRTGSYSKTLTFTLSTTAP
jgi:peptidoglycan/xylan/chitin deacetylase (PgdA/CDA1 family)